MSSTRTDPKKKNPPPPPNPQVRYQLRQSFGLSLVPLTCGLLLVLLLVVFSKLNLFYLEANGLILDGQVRGSYFSHVRLEFLAALGFLALQLLVTFAVSYVVMRWATAPFTGAYRMVELAIHSPEPPRPLSRLLSESPRFDRVIWNFCQRLRGVEMDEPREFDSFFLINFRFLVKFLLASAALSALTGYVTLIILNRVYSQIVDMALQLVQSSKSMPHYFLAQQEILTDAAILLSCLSFVAFAVIGFQISRYMATMIFVFSRSIQDDQFPITLRGNDCYRDLSGLLNQARKNIT